MRRVAHHLKEKNERKKEKEQNTEDTRNYVKCQGNPTDQGQTNEKKHVQFDFF